LAQNQSQKLQLEEIGTQGTLMEEDLGLAALKVTTIYYSLVILRAQM
jgi:hypothetical protein